MNYKVSLRWVAVVITGMVISVFALSGTAAAPPAATSVRVVDATNTSQAAHVDANGNLRVGGSVGINPQANTVTLESSAPVSVTTADDPARVAFQYADQFEVNPTNSVGSAFFDVPAGKRLVITYFSGAMGLPHGQRLLDVSLLSFSPESGPLHPAHHFVPTFTGTAQSGVDLVVFSGETTFYVDDSGGPAGDIYVQVSRDSDQGTGSGSFTISGYLIDCSAAACK
jgi:hypothetical protein